MKINTIKRPFDNLRLSMLVVLSILVGCGQKNDVVVIDQFPINDTLISKQVKIPENVQLSAAYLFATQNSIVVYSPQKDTLFDVFELSTMNHMASVGLKGNGPNDLSSIDRSSFIPTADGFMTFMMKNNTFLELIFSDRVLNVARKETWDLESSMLNRVLRLNDSIVIYPNEQAENNAEFKIFNRNTGKTSSFGTLPNDWFAQDVDDSKKIWLLTNNCVAHPDGTKFASFYFAFKKIRFYSSDGVLQKDISVEIKPYVTEFSDKQTELITSYYGYPVATSKYIYAICSNSKEPSKAKDVELQVWDWNGDPTARYVLDRGIFMITIPDVNNEFYGVDYQDNLYKYNIPEL